jgi:serine/threonine protein kinase
MQEPETMAVACSCSFKQLAVLANQQCPVFCCRSPSACVACLLRQLCLLLLQVNNLREIQALRRLSPHPHIIQLLEVLYDQPTGRLALVFELMVGAAWLAWLQLLKHTYTSSRAAGAAHMMQCCMQTHLQLVAVCRCQLATAGQAASCCIST